jgi:ketosteroid isomerase-like protein
VRRLLLILGVLALAALVGGCAGSRPKKEAGPKNARYASADAKNVHDFIVKYPAVVMSGDVKANLRLYAEGAKVVPFLNRGVRPLRSTELPQRLPEILAEERKMGLRIQFLEPMQIEAKSEQASVHVVAKLAWQERGKERQAAMNCYFALSRDENLLWKIKEAHAEPVKADFNLPAKPVVKKPLPPRDPMLRPKRVIKGEPPAPEPPKDQPDQASQPSPQPAPPGPQDTQDAGQPAGPPPEKGPQPLF